VEAINSAPSSRRRAVYVAPASDHTSQCTMLWAGSATQATRRNDGGKAPPRYGSVMLQEEVSVPTSVRISNLGLWVMGKTLLLLAVETSCCGDGNYRSGLRRTYRAAITSWRRLLSVVLLE